MRHRVDALRKPRHYRPAVANQRSDELLGSLDPLLARVARSDDRDTPRLHEVPLALEVEKLDGVRGIPKLRWVLPGPVDANPEEAHASFAKVPDDLRRHRFG